MSSISVPNVKLTVPQVGRQSNYWQLARGYAGIIDSRESTYRTFLDLTGYFLPMVAANATRNIWNFLETAFEAALDVLFVFSAPYITTLNGYLCSKFVLKKEEQKDYLNYLNFQIPELDTCEKFKQGLERMKKEEPSDRKRVSELYRNLGKEDKAKYYLDKAEEIKRFTENFELTDEKRKRTLKLKQAVILFESFIEGVMFASEGVLTRFFRRYVLGKEQFTGTLGYSSDTSGNFGGSNGFSLWQKLGIGFSCIISPLINGLFFLKSSNPETIENNKFLKVLNSHFDMTHGVFPRLGLLFTYVTFPYIFAKIFTSQDKYELMEMFIKTGILTPSWWFGHRATNGVLAKKNDLQLEKEFGTRGVLVGAEAHTKADTWLSKLAKIMPEPSRIQHVMDSTEGNQGLREKSIELHAKTLYKGFALHSFLIWLMMLGANYFTKYRVTKV